MKAIKKQENETLKSQEEIKESSKASGNGNAIIEKRPKIGYTRNKHGVKVKRWCASCLHMGYNENATRVCSLWNEKVKACSRCKKWRMSENMHIAGNATGVVRDKVTKEVILR